MGNVPKKGVYDVCLSSVTLKEVSEGAGQIIQMGIRLITKFGEKGAVNLVKMVPLVGVVIVGGIDIAGTKTIAKVAYDMFIEGKM